MEGMLKNKTLVLCRALTDLKATSVVGMCMDEICSWTYYLIIGTVRSSQHMYSISSELTVLMHDMGMNVSAEATRKLEVEEGRIWNMIDGGDIVLSLMANKAREFYSLEDLWYEAEVIYRENKDEIHT